MTARGPLEGPSDDSRAGATVRSATRLLRNLRQPDQLSCGATTLVAAQLLLDPAYAALINEGRHPVTGHQLSGPREARFRDEVLALHRRVTGPVDVRGHLQPPWPRALGTPPWAVARQLSALGRASRAPLRHRVRPVVFDRTAAYDRILAAVRAARPVPLYVGNRWSPRHVVLCVGETSGELHCYEPGSGRVVVIPRDDFVGNRLGLAGWDRAWLVVLPTRAAA